MNRKQRRAVNRSKRIQREHNIRRNNISRTPVPEQQVPPVEPSVEPTESQETPEQQEESNQGEDDEEDEDTDLEELVEPTQSFDWDGCWADNEDFCDMMDGEPNYIGIALKDNCYGDTCEVW